MDRPYERIYTVNDYYDGPRAGFADFDGVPHAYASAWSDQQGGWEPFYRLWPVSADVLALALEDREIWERWQDAFYAGETTQATHPALPTDAERHREIAPVIDRVLEGPPEDYHLATADFRVLSGGEARPPGRMRPLEVRWTAVEHERSR
jgi:hypothetical protein